MNKNGREMKRKIRIEKTKKEKKKKQEKETEIKNENKKHKKIREKNGRRSRKVLDLPSQIRKCDLRYSGRSKTRS